MPFAFDDPMIQSSLLPLGLSFLLSGIIRLLLGRHLGPRMANVAVGLSFLTLIFMVQGIMFPPASSTHKLPYLVLIAIVLGAACDAKALTTRSQLLLFAGYLGAALWWLNQTRWNSADNLLLFKVGAIYLLGVFIAARLLALRGQRLTPVLMLLFASAGLGVLALFGASALLTTLGFVLAAALGGFALWNWPKHRYPLGGGIIFAGAGGLMLLTNQALLLTQTSPIALCLLLPLLLANRLARPMVNRWQLKDAGRPLVITLCCIIIVAASVAVANYISPISSDMGY